MQFQGALVRNHCINNRWAAEERVSSGFPFTQGITFDMKITLGSEFLTVSFFLFGYCSFTTCSSITNLLIFLG